MVTGLLGLSPALADTKDELEDAKAELAKVQGELDQAVAAWSAAQSRLGQTRHEMDVVRSRIGDLQHRLDVVNERLQARAALAYQVGPASSIEALLSSSSFSDFSDRLEFLGSMTQSDVDLALERQVAEVELGREQDDLENLTERQRETVDELDAVRERIDEKFGEIDARVDDLTARYNEEQAAARRLELLRQASTNETGGNGAPNVPITNPGSGIQVCPVAGPNSFIDSFGDPRVGHTHQGIDLIAPFGTPIVAAHPGSVTRSSSTDGGLQAYVRASSGTYTFYAHLSSYSDASGTVGAGAVIGYVGSTGNAGDVNHLHFEYHPGGGAAIDPYQMLVAVC